MVPVPFPVFILIICFKSWVPPGPLRIINNDIILKLRNYIVEIFLQTCINLIHKFMGVYQSFIKISNYLHLDRQELIMLIIYKDMLTIKQLIFLVLLCSSSLALLSRTTDKVWPKPLTFTTDTAGSTISISPCNMKFTVNADTENDYVRQIISMYQTKVFHCNLVDQARGDLTIAIINGGQMTATDVSHQKYTLSMPREGKWTLKADYYVGFLRGFQTFSQLFDKQEDGSFTVSGLPITVVDKPQFIWRSLLIDTSRHYLSVPTIKRIVDSMLYIKLNVLHWHIIDEDSFPMVVPDAPELSDFGQIGGIFTQSDIKDVISYCKTRGIRVIPEIDTPAHTDSWGRNQKYKNITLNCNGKYMGQFDPTLDLTYQVLNKVMAYVNNTFQENYIHFGGDQVQPICWDKRPSIKSFMTQNNISDYEALSIYYRRRQKAQFRANISSTKKVIYWANEEIDLPVEDEDVIHWWGDQANQSVLSGRKSEVILSNYDLVYLDTGFNNIYGANYGTFKTWRKMYTFDPIIPNANVIGGATCMWNEIGTKHTFDQKVLQKANILSQRLWNTNINLDTQINNIARRLQAQSERLRSRGYKVWPVTVELCEKNMNICF